MEIRELGEGVVDDDGVRGAFGSRTWGELESAAPGSPVTFRKLFGFRDPTFRRLDPMSRALVLAAEGTGIRDQVTAEHRDDTAIVVTTCLGCLDTDLVFARSIGTEMPDGPAFAYTLPSTCLGEVALRYGLRGPSLCLSTLEGDEAVARREGEALLREGVARYALVAAVEVLVEPHPTATPSVFARAVLLGC